MRELLRGAPAAGGELVDAPPFAAALGLRKDLTTANELASLETAERRVERPLAWLQVLVQLTDASRDAEAVTWTTKKDAEEDGVQ